MTTINNENKYLKKLRTYLIRVGHFYFFGYMSVLICRFIALKQLFSKYIFFVKFFKTIFSKNSFNYYVIQRN